MVALPDEYAAAETHNEKYRLLRDELARLRGQRDEVEYFEEAAVKRDIRQFNADVDGELVVFVANDFGRPRAYRSERVAKTVQNDIREALLQDKYDDTTPELNRIRRALLDAHPGLHKVIVAEHSDGAIRYHLPEGSNDATNFITVREMVGLIDYTTNSFQSDGLSVTY